MYTPLESGSDLVAEEALGEQCDGGVDSALGRVLLGKESTTFLLGKESTTFLLGKESTTFY